MYRLENLKTVKRKMFMYQHFHRHIEKTEFPLLEMTSVLTLNS